MPALEKKSLKYGNAKKIIGVVSGKGGVGKSTVTSILAIKLAKQGYKVGVLDGDIIGPSIPRIFGKDKLRGNVKKVTDTELMFSPIESKYGIKLASFNFYTVDEAQAVMWRGPILSSTLTQIYQEVVWEELDFLLIDMPPGTGDTAITVMQGFKLDGIVAVGTPQKMVSVIVKKIVNMAAVLNTPVVGLVENLSYITASNGEKLNVWGRESAEWHANDLNLPLLAEFPINHELGDSLENGTFEEYVYNNNTYDSIVDTFLKNLNK
jgi:ATP-binding protein involved in chromosome partitioning